MLKKLLIISAIFLLSSCYPYWYKPYGSIFKNLPKGGTPGFNLGWIHGCESGLGSDFGGNIFMTFYTWHKDVDIASFNLTPDSIERVRKRYPKELAGVNWNDSGDITKNFRDYNSIFWAGHSFCHNAIIGQLTDASMNPAIPGDERVQFDRMSIGNVYKIDGRGDARLGNGYW